MTGHGIIRLLSSDEVFVRQSVCVCVCVWGFVSPYVRVVSDLETWQMACTKSLTSRLLFLQVERT